VLYATTALDDLQE